jgi:hypothetical protein
MEVTVMGAYTVRSDEMSATVAKGETLLKRFAGETAWSDAERYASDLYFADMRA